MGGEALISWGNEEGISLNECYDQLFFLRRRRRKRRETFVCCSKTFFLISPAAALVIVYLFFFVHFSKGLSFWAKAAKWRWRRTTTVASKRSLPSMEMETIGLCCPIQLQPAKLPQLWTRCLRTWRYFCLYHGSTYLGICIFAYQS